MKIARYIGDLLFQYECIVIPGFGGFITKEIPAQIHPIQNHFVPPTKGIVFNVHLKANDGLLINHIVRAEKITYTEAKKSLENFVVKCENALKNGKRIHFRKVGTLFINEAGFKQFEPDVTQNYLADSYGLKSFISPPIKRTPGGRPIKKAAPDRKAAEVHRREKAESKSVRQKVKKGPKYVHINISAVVILVLISAYVFFNFTEVKKYYHNNSSLIPFSYSNPNDYILTNYVKLGLNKISDVGDNLKDVGDKFGINLALPSDAKKTPAKEEKPESIEDTYEKLLKELQSKTIEAEDTPSREAEVTSKVIEKPKQIQAPEKKTETKKEVVIKSPETYKFHIIAGSFQNLANAQNFVQALKQKGFNANIAGTNKYNQYRVAYSSYNILTAASKRLAYIRKEENASAWILSN